MKTTIGNILALPNSAVTNTTLTKQFFYKNFDLTSAEKKLIRNIIQEMQIYASISKSTTNIPECIEEDKTFENIFIILVELLPKDFSQRETVATTIQKYFPYHCMAIVFNQEEFIINLAKKRINKNDASKRLVVSEINTPIISTLVKDEFSTQLFNQLNFKNLDLTNLKTLYNAYVNAGVNYKASIKTKKLVKHSSARTEQDVLTLIAIDNLEAEILHLDNQITKEKRTNAIVELSNQRWGLKQQLNDLKEQLN